MKTSSSLPPVRHGAVLALIGNTPLLPLRFEPEGVILHAKCELLNPSGSIKDRLPTASSSTPSSAGCCGLTR